MIDMRKHPEGAERLYGPYRRPLETPTPFQRRFFANVVGPFPVLLHNGRWGFEKRQFFDPRRVREFEIYYGFNPRCCRAGGTRTPYDFNWRPDWWDKDVERLTLSDWAG